MQVIKKNLRQGEVVVKVDTKEDLWQLSQLIRIRDRISGKTERKIKIGGGSSSDDRKQTIVKKTIFIELEVEKLEFHKTSDELRINGIVTEGPEDVPKGSHHTIEVEPGTTLGIKKSEWLSFELEKLDEAINSISTKIVLVIFDREEAIFAMLKNRGHELLSSIKGDVSKKGFQEDGKKSFYSEIVQKLEEYNARFEPRNIIIASPSFWKEYLMKEIPDELKKKITLASCSDVSEGAIKEVLQRPELKKVLESDRASKELAMVEDILKAISKNEACYGLAESEEKVNLGAVKELIVSYDYLNKERESGKGEKVERVMKLAEERGGKVSIISTEGATKKIDGLGGVAGILRWKSIN
jgi:protein pelota